jgi:hypothetical protein
MKKSELCPTCKPYNRCLFKEAGMQLIVDVLKAPDMNKALEDLQIIFRNYVEEANKWGCKDAIKIKSGLEKQEAKKAKFPPGNIPIPRL